MESGAMFTSVATPELYKRAPNFKKKELGKMKFGAFLAFSQKCSNCKHPLLVAQVRSCWIDRLSNSHVDRTKHMHNMINCYMQMCGKKFTLRQNTYTTWSWFLFSNVRDACGMLNSLATYSHSFWNILWEFQWTRILSPGQARQLRRWCFAQCWTRATLLTLFRHRPRPTLNMQRSLGASGSVFNSDRLRWPSM